MVETNDKNCSTIKSSKIKFTAMEMALEQTLSLFKDLAIEFEQIISESENYQTQLLSQREMCDRKTCKGSIELKKDLELKENIIQSVASLVTKLFETKNFGTISEIYKCLRGDVNLLTPPIDNIPNGDKIKVENIRVSPKQEESPVYESPFEEESISEIDATPTGRSSPIIFSKKMRNNASNMFKAREKKKCPDDWSTPEKKNIKLSYPTPTRNKPGGRLRQARLNLVRVKSSSVVDLTSSPECSRTEACDVKLHCNVKKEVVDDETILPSPTSGPVSFQPHKSSVTDSPMEFKRPPPTIKLEDGMRNVAQIKEHSPAKLGVYGAVEDVRIPSIASAETLESMKCSSPANESMSLLRHVKLSDTKKPALSLQKQSPPGSSKPPLTENNNIVNVERAQDGASVSVARDSPLAAEVPAGNHKKRVKPENREPVYKEPTVRRKADKRALPGWSCEQCKTFYDELYEDNPEMLAQLMKECSKHRGRNNPVRSATPPGFWYPRWDVPEDTEEFNRRNNAL